MSESLVATLEGIEARNKALATNETFGHLYPKVDNVYQGYIEFVYSPYGDIVLMDAQFGKLPNSPLLWEDVNNLIGDLCLKKWSRNRRGEYFSDKHLEHGYYRWEGCYQRFKNGTTRFIYGKLKKAAAPRYVEKPIYS